MARSYKLARSTIAAPGGDLPYEYPYEVIVSFDAVSHPIGLSEGLGHGSAGSMFTLEEALRSDWDDHFDRAGGSWLRPYLERMLAGEQVRDEVLAHYRSLHHRDPVSYD